jgi:UDP-N-acetylglucosamine--N-acetylmuramyl-(pentapeptide) pyrophosphoryl-undecaprenol N-acetylglucosamine transferase
MHELIYASSNIGYGHISRDIAICTSLDEMGIKPILISGKTIRRFVESYSFKFIEYYGEPLLTIMRGKVVGVSLWYLRYWLRYRKGFKWFKKLYRELNMKLVVSDEDFIILGNAQKLNIPTILITDQLGVAFAKTRIAGFFEEKINKWMQEKILNSLKVIIPDFKSDHDYSNDNIVYVGPIVRDVKRNRNDIRKELNIADHEKLIVITGGGSNLGKHIISKIINEVSLLKSDYKFFVVGSFSNRIKHDGRFIVRDFVKDLHEYIAAADLVISLAGKSTIDEALVYGTPIITIPIKNHFEQEYNAAKLGFSYEDLYNIRNLVETMIGKRREPLVNDGRKKAAKEIMNTLNTI